MKYRSLLVVVVASILVAACATAPSNKFVYMGSESESKIKRIGSMAVLADACFYRDELGDDDYWVVQPSRAVEDNMLEAAKTYLAGKGYEVSYAHAPFVGGFKKSDVAFRVSQAIGGEVTEIRPPLFESESVAKSPALKEALLNVMPRIPGSKGGAGCCSNSESREQMRMISQTVGGDATLFLIGHGTMVSGGKQFAQGLATGLITAALTLGTVSVMHMNVSFMDTYAVLVDNSTGEVLWSNSMRLKGEGFTDKDFYEPERWPKTILYHLPGKNDEKKEAEAATKDNSPEKTEGGDVSASGATEANFEKGQGQQTIDDKGSGLASCILRDYYAIKRYGKTSEDRI